MARIFARPSDTESIEDVLAAVHAGRIGSFAVFKWRVAMALQGEDTKSGVRLDDIWQRVDNHFGGPARIGELTGWPIDEIRTIDAYRGSPASYHFPSVREMVDVFSDALECVDEKRAKYELAERCPILVFKRKATR
jgi:hypothetical protein